MFAIGWRTQDCSISSVSLCFISVRIPFEPATIPKPNCRNTILECPSQMRIWTQISEKTQPIGPMKPSKRSFVRHQTRPSGLNGWRKVIIYSCVHFSHIWNQSNMVSRQLCISCSVFKAADTSWNIWTRSVPLRFHTLASKHSHRWRPWRQRRCGAAAQRTESLRLAKRKSTRGAKWSPAGTLGLLEALSGGSWWTHNVNRSLVKLWLRKARKTHKHFH